MNAWPVGILLELKLLTGHTTMIRLHGNRLTVLVLVDVWSIDIRLEAAYRLDFQGD